MLSSDATSTAKSTPASGHPLEGTQSSQPSVNGGPISEAALRPNLPEATWREPLDPAPRPRTSLSTRDAFRLGALGLALVLLGGVAGLAFALVSTKIYAARVDIRYDISAEQPTAFLREDRTLTTQVVLLHGQAVLGPVAGAFGLSMRDIEEKVSAEILETSEIIQIEVHDESPEQAVAIAEAVGNRYLALTADTDIEGVRTYLEGELAAVRQARGALRRDQPGSLEADALGAREQDLLSQLDKIRTGANSGPTAEIVSPAYLLERPVRPSRSFSAITGALTGLLVAAGVVALRARRAVRANRAAGHVRISE
jgi:uncharacterized protein involved in exopolysaccharide biosynthesis